VEREKETPEGKMGRENDLTTRFCVVRVMVLIDKTWGFFISSTSISFYIFSASQKGGYS
jgi:hypothetical protein